MMGRAERLERLLTVKARLEMSRCVIPATGRAGSKHTIESPEKNTWEGRLGTLRWNYVTDISQMLMNSKDDSGG